MNGELVFNTAKVIVFQPNKILVPHSLQFGFS